MDVKVSSSTGACICGCWHGLLPRAAWPALLRCSDAQAAGCILCRLAGMHSAAG